MFPLIFIVLSLLLPFTLPHSLPLLSSFTPPYSSFILPLSFSFPKSHSFFLSFIIPASLHLPSCSPYPPSFSFFPPLSLHPSFSLFPSLHTLLILPLMRPAALRLASCTASSDMWVEEEDTTVNITSFLILSRLFSASRVRWRHLIRGRRIMTLPSLFIFIGDDRINGLCCNT